MALLLEKFTPESVLAEVEQTLCLGSDTLDLARVRQVHADVIRVFRGGYPGYRASTNAYHDLDHTMLVFLAMARLTHGAIVGGCSLSDRGIERGVIAAMFHDIGFIQSEDDTEGTGAKYTTTHEERGMQFARSYFADKGFDPEGAEAVATLLHGTCLRQDFDTISFVDKEGLLLGQLLGTADLLAQMGDRVYLEKLLFLYREFDEAGITMYADELDLLDKTLGFWELMKKRLAGPLGGVCQYARQHFKARFGVDEDLYEDAIERQIAYLQEVLTDHRDDYRSYLRRDQLMARLHDIEVMAPPDPDS